MMNPKSGASSPGASKRIGAFAIPDAPWPSESVVTEILLSLITEPPARVAPSTEAKTDYFRVIVSVATNAWRARNEMTEPHTGKIREDMKSVAAHIDAIYKNLGELGIVIQDHTGQVYDETQSLNVIETKPIAGLDKTLVMETVLPSIYWNERLIQNGEVIIVTPPPSDRPVF